MANHPRDLAKEGQWRARLKQHAASGLSVRAFCRHEEVTESAFYFWRRVIAERDGEKAPPASPISERRTASPSSERRPALPSFVPVTVAGLPTDTKSIAIELAEGRVLRLPESITAARLAELVHALESRGEP